MYEEKDYQCALSLSLSLSLSLCVCVCVCVCVSKYTGSGNNNSSMAVTRFEPYISAVMCMRRAIFNVLKLGIKTWFHNAY